jgi:uncharacterized delta-60 repeat protein
MCAGRRVATLAGLFGALASPLAAQSVLDPSFGVAGRLVLPFSTTMHDRIEAVAPLPDGRFLGAGWVQMEGGDLHTLIVRFLPDGRIDSTFGERRDGRFLLNVRRGGEEEKPRAVAIQHDGRIVVAGQVEGDGPDTDDFMLLRLTPEGRLDSTFAEGRGVAIRHLSGPVDKIRSMALMPDDRIVCVGHSDDAFSVARFTGDGVPDASFGRAGVTTVRFPGEGQGRGIALLTDGAVLVTGYTRPSHQKGVPATTYVLRVTSSGALDSAWAPGGAMVLPVTGHEVRAYIAAPLPGGGALLGGRLRVERGRNADFFVVRLHADGEMDQEFGTDGLVTIDFDGRDDTVRGLVPLADGRLLVAGFSLVGEDDEDFALALLGRRGRLQREFDEDGRARLDFGGERDKLRGATLLPDGNVLAYGHAEHGRTRDAALAKVRVPGRSGGR